MKNRLLSCKYCSNYRISVYGPMGTGFCGRKEYKIVFNDKLGVYERERLDGCEDIEDCPESNPHECAHFKPMMPEETQEWFRNLFGKSE